MTFHHYDHADWKFDPQYPYFTQDHFKPRGLWLSDDSQDYGWLEWCEDNEYRTDHYLSQTEFAFAEGANILHLRSFGEVMTFQKMWFDTSDVTLQPVLRRVNWAVIAKQYDGILISPYDRVRTWEVRCPLWYSGWDVPSACVWNLDAVVNVRQSRLDEEINKALEELKDPKKAWDSEFERLSQNN